MYRAMSHLRRRSPGPPFPPDHRQAGERRAIREIKFGALTLPVLPARRPAVLLGE